MIVDRRHLLKGAAAGSALAAAPLGSEADAKTAPAKKLKPVKARIGHELQGVLNDKTAAYLARFGVNGVGCAAVIQDRSTRAGVKIDVPHSAAYSTAGHGSHCRRL